MPNYKGHLVGGVVAFALMLTFIRDTNPSWLTMAEWCGWSLLGSLFPDIDTKSKGQKLFYRVLAIGLLYLFIKQKIKSFIFLSLVGIVPQLVNHRGLFHRTWFLIGGCLMIFWYVKTYFPYYTMPVIWSILFFGAGVVSHLFLDFGPVRMIKRR